VSFKRRKTRRKVRNPGAQSALDSPPPKKIPPHFLGKKFAMWIPPTKAKGFNVVFEIPWLKGVKKKKNAMKNLAK
jgi:hypothetical protein